MLGNIISVYQVSSELNFPCCAEKFAAGAPELGNGGKFMQKIFISLYCFRGVVGVLASTDITRLGLDDIMELDLYSMKSRLMV